MGFKSFQKTRTKRKQQLNQTKFVIICHDALKLNFQCLKTPLLAPILEPKLGFFIICWKTFDNMLENFGKPILEPNPPKTDQDEPKRAIKAAKSQKTAFTKRWFSRGTVGIFSLLKRPKSASRSPRDSQETPKELQNHPKKYQKLDPKINKFWTNFGFQNGFQKYPPKLLQEE